MPDQPPSEPGGFLPPAEGLLSPAPATAVVASPAAASLPQPRRKPLNPGGGKEDQVRRDLEEALLSISRRYVKKFSGPDPSDAVVGFETFGEVTAALDAVIDTLWRSGTPSLQVPFLLKVCGDFTQYVRSFPPAPAATFRLLGKMDHCFASLLCGKDIVTQETLPGFENGLRGGMTTTDMVRCRSLVEQTRVLIVEIMSNESSEDSDSDDEDEYDEEDDDDDNIDGDDDGDDDDDNHDKNGGDNNNGVFGDSEGDEQDLAAVRLGAARVFEHSIVQLNNRMGDGGLAST